MKKIWIMAIGFISCLTYAQNDEAVSPSNNTLVSIASQGAGYRGGTGVVFNPPRNVEGTVYLYDTWKNNVIIETSDRSFKLSNINFNAKKNTFESKIQGSDSIFTFDFTNIDRLLVNNKPFRKIYSPIVGGHKLYEVVAEGGDFAIYKDYYIEIKEGNPNPMLARTNDKYIMRDSYYVKKGKTFKRLKLKKSSILKAFGNKAKKVDEYAKSNNLNFKNGQDLQKLASFYGSL